MSTVEMVAASLDAVMGQGNSAEWDPTGLQIGTPGAIVERAAVCHEVTEAVVDVIDADPVDLLITYHPLLFSPVNRILGGRSPAARAARLIRAGVNLFVAHTNFDAAPGGAADSLAAALNLEGLSPFGGSGEAGDPMIGRFGRFDGSLDDLVGLVASALGGKGLRVSAPAGHPSSVVAVVPGSGSDLIDAASDVADVMVTGDVSHHRCVGALDRGMAVIDPGHIATERPGLRALLEMARSAIDVETVDLTALDPETWA